jgi:branched-chain amino acid transport system permease protein
MRKKNIRALVFIGIGLALYLLSNVVGEYRVSEGTTAACYVIAIASIVLLTGYTGQISLGHGALMAVGAYAAVLARTHWHISLALTFVVAVLAAAVAGALLGVAAGRLRGPYLAGTTLALAVGLPTLANQFKILGGEQGLIYDTGSAPDSMMKNNTDFKWYFWISALAALIILWLLSNLLSSRYGRQWRALRSAPLPASLAGLNVARSKVLAFTISSGVAGLAGAVLAMSLKLVAPSDFPLALSFTIVTGAVLAGVSSLAGTIFGALVLVAIPELTSSLGDHFAFSERVASNLPGFITSLLLIATVIFLPNGPKFLKK